MGIEDNDLELHFDPSQNEVLGVVGNNVHIKCDEYILIMSKTLFHKTWKNWLNGKQEYCENKGYYCGVGGYTHAIKYKQTNPITLNIYSQSDKDYRKVEFDAYIVTEFDKYHDFEHG